MNKDDLKNDYKKLLEKYGLNSIAVVQPRSKKAEGACPPGQRRVRIVGSDGKISYVCM